MGRQLGELECSGKFRFYVVFEGREPGIYDNWEDAKAQVNGFSSQKYKGFHTRSEARKAYRDYLNSKDDKPTNKPKKLRRKRRRTVVDDDMPPWDL